MKISFLLSLSLFSYIQIFPSHVFSDALNIYVISLGTETPGLTFSRQQQVQLT
jgi:hypothetical protein